MKNLIVVIGDNKYQFDTKEELMQILLGDSKKDYNTMTEEEKKKRRYLKAYANVRGDEKRIVDLQEKIQQGEEEISIDDKFLIDNDEVYVLSLIKISDIILLEHKDSNCFNNGIDKKGITDNYLVINGYASEIIQNYKQKLIQKNSKIERDGRG